MPLLRLLLRMGEVGQRILKHFNFYVKFIHNLSIITAAEELKIGFQQLFFIAYKGITLSEF